VGFVGCVFGSLLPSQQELRFRDASRGTHKGTTDLNHHFAHPGTVFIIMASINSNHQGGLLCPEFFLPAHLKVDRLTSNKQTDGHTDRQTDRQTDRPRRLQSVVCLNRHFKATCNNQLDRRRLSLLTPTTATSTNTIVPRYGHEHPTNDDIPMHANQIHHRGSPMMIPMHDSHQ